MTRNLGSTELKRLHRAWRRRADGRVALLLDSVATPANVGAIVRTAAALRVDDLWCCGQTPDLDHPGVGRTALGTERYLQIHRCEDAVQALAAARAAGYRVIGIELADDAVAIHEADLRGAVCLVVGHEDRGLSPGVLRGLDAVAFIPQLGRVGSLSVATAASVACYEARRQGWPTGPREDRTET